MTELRLKRRFAVGLCAGALAATTLAGCGQPSGTPTLTWFINPDNGGQAQFAQQCADASDGAYEVRIETLPSDATHAISALGTWATWRRLTRHELRTALRSWAFVVLVLFWMMAAGIEIVSEVTSGEYGARLLPTTAVVVASLIASVILFAIDSLAYQLMVDWLPFLWSKL